MKLLLIFYIILNTFSAVWIFNSFKNLVPADKKSRYQKKVYLIAAIIKMGEAAVLTVALKQLS